MSQTITDHDTDARLILRCMRPALEIRFGTREVLIGDAMQTVIDLPPAVQQAWDKFGEELTVALRESDK